MAEHAHRHRVKSKVPEVTIGFWITKIVATTLGETGGDTLTMTALHATGDHPNAYAYLIGTAIMGVILFVLVAMQVSARRFNPWLYWLTIIGSTTCGTTLADFADRSLGIGYAGGSLILLACVLGSLFAWRQTLGTALGDWMADSGLGYAGAALVFGVALAIVAWMYFKTEISNVALFWAAFVLTRPLGATLGDFLDKPLGQGGLELSRAAATVVLFVAMGALIYILPQRPARHGEGKSQA
jgi:uncharacterized membrane-anchored protein